MSSYKLRQELLNDPLAAGYAGMTDAQVLALILDTSLRAAPDRTSLNGGELYDLMDDEEFEGLAAEGQAAIRELYGIGTITVSAGSRARTKLQSILTLGAAPVTRQKLIDMVIARKQSRAQELGIRQSSLTESGVAACRLPDQP